MRAGLALAALLAGCATQAPPLTASVEIPVPCVGKRPVRPNFLTETDLAKLPDYEAVTGLELLRVQAFAYIDELEAVVDGCSRLPATR